VLLLTIPYPSWLATDAILNLFSHNRRDDKFVEKYQSMQDKLNGNLKDNPFKQRRKPALTLLQYQQQSSSRDEAIFLSYQSGGYTLKDIGEHFKLHYSRVSRIIAKGKT
jgi:hypothetical protein